MFTNFKNRFVFLTLILLCFSILCNGARRKKRRYKQLVKKEASVSPKQLVEQYFKAAFDEKYGTLEKILANDLVFYGPKLKDSLNKEKLIISWKSTHLRNDSMFYQNPESFISIKKNDKNKSEVWVMHYYTAKFHNRDYNTWAIFRVHVKFLILQNQISKAFIYVNQSDIQQQIGYKNLKPEEYKALKDSIALKK
ncbi:MAG: hypothetical protein SFY32_03740 [Bacteroidota bacterium]|nr:hypothetical protein [Bacteroidota bacterium]